MGVLPSIPLGVWELLLLLLRVAAGVASLAVLFYGFFVIAMSGMLADGNPSKAELRKAILMMMVFVTAIFTVAGLLASFAFFSWWPIITTGVLSLLAIILYAIQ